MATILMRYNLPRCDFRCSKEIDGFCSVGQDLYQKNVPLESEDFALHGHVNFGLHERVKVVLQGEAYRHLLVPRD